MVATQILATVDTERLQRAVEAFCSGAFSLTIASHSPQEIRGFVANGDGKEYGVVLANGHAFCSCPDAMYRKVTCKHAVALALHVIRHLVEQPAEERTPDLRLGKVRRNFDAAA